MSSKLYEHDYRNLSSVFQNYKNDLIFFISEKTTFENIFFLRYSTFLKL